MSRKVALESEKDIDRRGGSRPAGEARSAVPAGKEGRREGGAPRPRCFPRRAAPKRLPRPRLLLSRSPGPAPRAPPPPRIPLRPFLLPPPPVTRRSDNGGDGDGRGTCQALNNHITPGEGEGVRPAEPVELTSRGNGGGPRLFPPSPLPTPRPLRLRRRLSRDRREKLQLRLTLRAASSQMFIQQG